MDRLSRSRRWIDKSGKFAIEAEFKGHSRGNVTLMRADNGKQSSIPLASLSIEDQEFVKRLLKEKATNRSNVQKPQMKVPR